MSDTFYCTTCGLSRPAADVRMVEVKRGRGYAKVKRCATCVERSKMSPEQRKAIGDKDRKELAKAKSYAKKTTVEAPDV